MLCLDSDCIADYKIEEGSKLVLMPPKDFQMKSSESDIHGQFYSRLQSVCERQGYSSKLAAEYVEEFKKVLLLFLFG